MALNSSQHGRVKLFKDGHITLNMWDYSRVIQGSSVAVQFAQMSCFILVFHLGINVEIDLAQLLVRSD